MKTYIYKTVFAIVFTFFCFYKTNAQVNTSGSKPLQVFVSIGENSLRLGAMNNLVSAQGFNDFRSLTYNVGVGIQSEIFKNIIFNTEVYTGRSFNQNGSFAQTTGGHATVGYLLINNRKNRFFPFVGVSINSLTLNATKSNTINSLDIYLKSSPDQLSIYSLAALGQVGIQCDVKKSNDDSRAKLSVRVGYGIGGNNDFRQRGTATILSGGPTVNPSGLYVRLYYFLK